MRHKKLFSNRVSGVASVALLWALAVPALAIDFAHDIVPLMKKHCGECHTGDAKQGGFSMNTREDLLAGGDSGTAPEHQTALRRRTA